MLHAHSGPTLQLFIESLRFIKFLLILLHVYVKDWKG